MKYWFDTEFVEDGRTIELISIGMVAEDGRELYCQNINCDLSLASAWVLENVIPHLSKDLGWLSHHNIGLKIIDFCDPSKYGKPEFWAYYADYDWVVMCQLFGTMMELPEGWPKYCKDIKQLCDDKGNPKLPKKNNAEHHALADARWNKLAWNFLQGV